MALGYYITCFVLCIINLLIFLIQKKSYISSLFTILFCILCIASSGYILYSLSDNVKEAIMSQKIIYLGGVFLPMITLLIVCRFIEYKYFKQALISGLILSISFYCLIFTIGYNNLYYITDKIKLVTANGVSVLEKEYGPMHFIYYVYTIGLIVTILGYLFYGFTKRNVSYKTLIYLCVLFILSIGSSVFQRLFKSNIDIVPGIYVLSGFLMLLMINKLKIYNLLYMDQTSHEEKNDEYFMGFDKNLKYLGSNRPLDKMFPEMSRATIDFTLPDGNLKDIINGLVNEFNSDNVDYDSEIEFDNKIYKISVSKYKYNRRELGYIVEIIDDTKTRKYIELLHNYSADLSNEVEKKTAKLKAVQDKILLGMANMVEQRDENTGGHVKRTTDTVGIIVNELRNNNIYNKDDEFYKNVKRAAAMHDLGKIGISDIILNKPGKFTVEEYEEMKRHAALGEKTVKLVLAGIENDEFVNLACNVAKYHHEKYDGTGYPEGLSGESIPVEARIMALADVYDALVSKRVYKDSFSFEKANSIIVESMGSHFDPKLLDIFNSCRVELENYYINNK